ncbi:maltose alpha-D-glucosyltransferase [Segetibacter koreensis]|uniref:maltose alpha-D-glucosyltransferase n=1 Tax=Segetibacter koreensis TaxID=398037 RepID=UPI00037B6FBC|nr:maltose alpha-D-glucosyltransferase [Segetibacter koreensis]
MDINTTIDDKLHWYKDAIIYELHIKAFCDGNGDGIGDFQGLFQKLDYLQDLGVTAIWVLPFYPSPLKDDGYDIADYYSINSRYGNITQFKQFLNEAHKRNLKVITELVINHTSDQHPWFQRARTASKGSPERDFYVWTDNPDQWKDVRIIFTDYEASNWTWDPVAQQYYWHRFFHHQPDLNYDSPLVQEEVIKILDYWCGMGVDGFRLDAVPYLFEREGTNGENLPETHAFLKKLRKHVDDNFPGTVFLAEANMWPEDSASYFGDGDECHMNYHFPVMPRMFMALQMEDRYPITDIFEQTPAIPANCQWAMFLRNHDELTLEMVTDEERDYMYKVYAKDPKAKINLGIRHRLAPLMGNNRRRIELMNCLLFSMPGTPVIYYGDEIGMGDNFYLGDRDGVRTPMQWSPDRNAGFSASNPQKLYLPVILDPEYHYEAVNVEMQRANTSSLFWFMKRMINIRKRFKAFGRGDLKFIHADNPKVLAFTRKYEDETLLVIVNLSKYSLAAEIDLSAYKNHIPVEVFSKNRFPVVKDSPYFFTLGAYAYEWFELENVNTKAQTLEALPTIRIETWDEILKESTLEEIQNNLASYLIKTDWFINKERSIQSIVITNHATIPTREEKVVLILVEVQFEGSLPESYQLPLTFAKEDLALKMKETCPEAIVAKLKIGGEEAILIDALFSANFQNDLIQKMAANDVIPLEESSIEFYGISQLKNQLQQQPDVKSKIHTEDGFTSINYDNGFFIKVYRKIDPTTNPDVEITRFLTEKAQFEHVPAFCGAIEWKFQNDTIALGMLQLLKENHGDAYSFMLTRIGNYIERILAAPDKGELFTLAKPGSLTNPVSFDELPEELQTLLGPTASEQVRAIGVRTGQMHLALASEKRVKDFAPEDFSLHYQRSLFSSMQSLVRQTFQIKKEKIEKLPDNVRIDLEEVLARRDDVLKIFKRIYVKKLDVIKTRIHGNYNLGQVLFTGKDIVINDFGGDPVRSFSDRRLKRSPLRDVAGMMRSIRYVANEGFMKTSQVPKEDIQGLLPFADVWALYMRGFFLRAYLETVKGSAFIPKDEDDLQMMLETYLLERVMLDLNYELNHRPDWVRVPLRVLKAMLDRM